MTYSEMDKRKLLLPDLLGKPLGVTTSEGDMVFSAGTKIPPKHYIFFYPVKEWIEIMSIVRGNE